jgi:hypothetical protein
MGNCGSQPDRAEKERSDAIDRQLEEDSKKFKKECKILLLGMWLLCCFRSLFSLFDYPFVPSWSCAAVIRSRASSCIDVPVAFLVVASADVEITRMVHKGVTASLAVSVSQHQSCALWDAIRWRFWVYVERFGRTSSGPRRYATCNYLTSASDCHRTTAMAAVAADVWRPSCPIS